MNKIKFFIKYIIRLYYKYLVCRRALKIGKGIRVNGKSIVTRNTVLGNNVNFNGIEITGRGKVIIGDNFHSGSECLIISQIHNYDYGECIPYDSTFIPKDVIIKDNVWIGSRVIILGGVTIGEGAIIQAGSTVVSNIPDYSIAGGSPARVFKTRNIEHYMMLKKNQRFF